MGNVRLRVTTIQCGLVVAHYLGNYEVQELLGELRIKLGILGQRAQSRNLLGLPGGIGGRETVRGFQLTDLLGDLEAFGKQMHKCGIHVVDAHPQPEQLIGHRVTHGAQPSQSGLRRQPHV